MTSRRDIIEKRIARIRQEETDQQNAANAMFSTLVDELTTRLDREPSTSEQYALLKEYNRRWQQYAFKANHRPGKRRQKVDPTAMSRYYSEVLLAPQKDYEFKG